MNLVKFRLQDEVGVVLTCLWSIGLIWESRYGKMREKHTFWAIFGDMYRYTLNMYRYSLVSGQIWLTCTGTDQRCTGTCTVLFSCSDQFSYFSHNLLISYPI